MVQAANKQKRPFGLVVSGEAEGLQSALQRIIGPGLLLGLVGGALGGLGLLAGLLVGGLVGYVEI